MKTRALVLLSLALVMLAIVWPRDHRGGEWHHFQVSDTAVISIFCKEDDIPQRIITLALEYELRLNEIMHGTDGGGARGGRMHSNWTLQHGTDSGPIWGAWRVIPEDIDE